MENALNWYLGFILPTSFWEYLGWSVIVMIVSVIVMCVYETQKMKNMNPLPKSLDPGTQQAICLGSFIISLIWPIILVFGPIALAVAFGLYSVMFMISEIVNLVLKVLK